MIRDFVLFGMSLPLTACLIVRPRDPVTLEQALRGHEAPVSSLSFNDDGSILASGSWDGTVVLWDASTHAPLGAPLVAGSDVLSVAFSRDGKLLAAGVADGTILVWDVQSRRPVGPSIPGHKEEVSRVAFSPDGRLLASGSRDRTVILWDVATWQPLNAPVLRHPGEVRSVAFSAQGDRLASVTDRQILIWNLSTWATIGPPLQLSRVAPLGDRPRFIGAAFSPGGGMLATVGDFRNARLGDSDFSGADMLLWDLAARQVIGYDSDADFLGYGNDVCFSSDGRTLALASSDVVSLWDVATRKPSGTPLRGYTTINISATVRALALSPDDRILAAGGGAMSRGSIIFWDIETRLPVGAEHR